MIGWTSLNLLFLYSVPWNDFYRRKPPGADPTSDINNDVVVTQKKKIKYVKVCCVFTSIYNDRLNRVDK